MAKRSRPPTPERWPEPGLRGLLLGIGWQALKDGEPAEAQGWAGLFCELRGERSIDRVTRAGNFAGAHVVA